MKLHYIKLAIPFLLLSLLMGSCHENIIEMDELAKITVRLPETKSGGDLPESFQASISIVSGGEEIRSNDVSFSRMEGNPGAYRANNAIETPLNLPVIIRVSTTTGSLIWQGESEEIILRPANAPYVIMIDLRLQIDPVAGNGVTDIDGNLYPTVVIGNHEWMASNLRVTQTNAGQPLTNAAQNAAWQQQGNLNQPAYSWYNNNQTNSERHGALYNWYAVQTDNICPEGWRLPSDQDWNTLINTIGTAAGRKMKSATGWHAGGSGTDLYGFNARPSGYRHYDGQFEGLTRRTFWWSNTQATNTTAWSRSITDAGSSVIRHTHGKEDGFSVRCFRSFTPTVILDGAFNVTTNSASASGFITDPGASPVQKAGIVWSTEPGPTIENNDGEQETFDVEEELFFFLEELEPETDYFLRLFAINNNGTSYSNQVAITTMSGGPVVELDGVFDITENSAVVFGFIEDTQGAEVLEVGVVWSTNPEPTIENNEGRETDPGWSEGEIFFNIEGLESGVEYFLRLYAVSPLGTGYSREERFTTR